MSRVDLQPTWVLHTRPYRDTSLLVELFSERVGRISAVARGARSSRRGGSAQFSLLQPFTPLLCSWTGKRDLKTLAGCEGNGARIPLQGERLFSGLYVNELLARLLLHDDPYPELFQYYRDILQQLAKGELVDLALRQFEFRLLESLGYGFALDVDGESGAPVSEQAFYEFHQDQGLIPSHASRSSEGVFAGADLLRIGRSEFDDTTRLCAKRLMRQALQCRLGGQPLKSRELFRKPS